MAAMQPSTSMSTSHSYGQEQSSRRSAGHQVRLTVLCAKNLVRKEFFKLPDPFVTVVVDGSGQSATSEICPNTLDPKWNVHFDLSVQPQDTVTVTVWNNKKVQRKSGSGFMGCVCLSTSGVQRMKDSGFHQFELTNHSSSDIKDVRGQVLISVSGKDHRSYRTEGADGAGPRSSLPSVPSLISAPWSERLKEVNTSPDQVPRCRDAPLPYHSSPNQLPGMAGVPRSQSGPQSALQHSSLDRRLNNIRRHSAVPIRQSFLPSMPTDYEMRTTTKGQIYYVNQKTGVSTWHDPRIPRDPSGTNHSHLGPLPAGWELRYTNSGRIYFVDHNNRTTQFTDPRLSRSTTFDHLDNEDLHLPKYKRDLIIKLNALRAELQQLQPQSGHCRIEVSREGIFEESYRYILKFRAKDLRKRLMVKFRGEDGIDYGGVAREWLYLLSHELLNPFYGLFQYSRDDIYTLQINCDSFVNPDHLSYFHFAGRILGLAIFHGHYIDAGFTLPFYKMLLGKPIDLDDIENVDPDLYRSLTWLLHNDIEGVLDLTFAVEHSVYGELKSHDLKSNGSVIPVTDDNKKEYVRLYVTWRFMQGIEAQFLALQKGFHEVIPGTLLKTFDERELELVICGLGRINVDDWKSNTRLKHCTADTPIVQWFWRAVDSFSDDMRSRLLQFVTGSSRVPLQGFKALQGSTGASGPRLFTIHQIDASTNNLPKAHTCFNRIDLPPYESYDKLLSKLTCAVVETCGFAVE
ncbi:hypothetical protein RvY_01332 [Ramazzottius varieornatus]|uniref:E3 ubiquitin-protein ligase n=1 Tax=Ramazzottius varieornatus TaxID=947166 RepID=A0A1D1UM12_RAMVA|nr:hypothetical protein RvY_01332 [Ramazzottius varieornatus]